MNVLPVLGFGLLFLYVAKSNKIEKKKALKSGYENIYKYGSLPDIIGDLRVGDGFTIELPVIREKWLLKATPPGNEISLEEKIVGNPNYFIFKAKKVGEGSIVIHRAISSETEPLEIIEVNVEVG